MRIPISLELEADCYQDKNGDWILNISKFFELFRDKKRIEVSLDGNA